jgi:hypothetical protein
MSRSAKFRFRLLMLVGILGAMNLFPGRAEAHLNPTGLGATYDGLAHFLLSPEDILPVLALALFAGQRSATRNIFFKVKTADSFADARIEKSPETRCVAISGELVFVGTDRQVALIT